MISTKLACRRFQRSTRKCISVYATVLCRCCFEAVSDSVVSKRTGDFYVLQHLVMLLSEQPVYRFLAELLLLLDTSSTHNNITFSWWTCLMVGKSHYILMEDYGKAKCCVLLLWHDELWLSRDVNRQDKKDQSWFQVDKFCWLMSMVATIVIKPLQGGWLHENNPLQGGKPPSCFIPYIKQSS